MDIHEVLSADIMGLQNHITADEAEKCTAIRLLSIFITESS